MAQAPGRQQGLQPGLLLLAQLARFAGMGVEAGYHQPGPGRKALAEAQQRIQFGFDPGPIQAGGHGGEGDVGGGQQGVEAPGAMGRPGREQHGGLAYPGQFGQSLGLTRVGMASGMPGLFGDRRGG